MSRTTRTRSLLLGVVAAAALAATGSGIAASAKTVNGTVGPGFTIGLTMQGKKVTKLKAGTAYRFVISDRSDIHDFHLSGPGVNRKTGVATRGHVTWNVTLRPGTYTYRSDKTKKLRGSFTVKLPF